MSVVFITAFVVLGFFGSCVFLKKKRKSPLSSEEALFKGIRYLITNEPDRAIEEFVKSVKLNSDTVETYITLADLYRSKGEIDRAIRIRQNVILRPNLDKNTKLMALLDLGLDYRKGGFLDRALSIFSQVIQEDPKNVKALKEMERIYEDLKEWDKAYETRKKIERLEKRNYKNILAHYLVEMAKQEEEKGDRKKAISLLNKAISTDPGCADAYLHLGDIYLSMGKQKDAISSWKKVLYRSPEFIFLAYKRLETSFYRIKDARLIEDFLSECMRKREDVFICIAYAKFLYSKGDVRNALEYINRAIKIDPSFWEARRLKGKILLEQGMKEEALRELSEIVESISTPYLKFQCEMCGFESEQLQWQCPQCKRWDTIHIKKTSISKE
jgi:lipopolysaccharide biosynthesis regulator YciM